MKTKLDFTPMILGTIAIIFTFFSKNLNFDFVLGISIVVAIRTLFLFYCISLCNTYKLNKILWVVLVLVFGGWGMIALNFGIFMSNTEDTNQLENDNDSLFAPNSQNDYENVQKNTMSYTNCPACLKDLKGQNRCIDCDLEFE